jgi:hypothetical protein
MPFDAEPEYVKAANRLEEATFAIERELRT